MKALLIASGERTMGRLTGVNGQGPYETYTSEYDRVTSEGHGGRINVTRLVQPDVFFYQSSMNAIQETHSRNFQMVAGKEVRVVLTWTDPPMVPVSGTAVLHDLNLGVRNGSNTEMMLGNRPGRMFRVNDFMRERSNDGIVPRQTDGINNVEVVRFVPTKSSGMTVHVRARYLLPSIWGAQPYALVVVGARAT